MQSAAGVISRSWHTLPATPWRKRPESKLTLSSARHVAADLRDVYEAGTSVFEGEEGAITDDVLHLRLDELTRILSKKRTKCRKSSDAEEMTLSGI